MKINRHIRYFSIYGICLGAMLWHINLAAVETDSAYLIEPGACVGKVCLNSKISLVRKLLGKPTVKGVAKGKCNVDYWKSRKVVPEYLFVVYQGEKIREIHVTSSAFRTFTGVSTASKYNQVVEAFPNGGEDEYVVFKSGHNRLDWHAINDGITFVFSGDKDGAMSRIVVHQKGVKKYVGYSESDDWYWYPNP